MNGEDWGGWEASSKLCLLPRLADASPAVEPAAAGCGSAGALMLAVCVWSQWSSFDMGTTPSITLADYGGFCVGR